MSKQSVPSARSAPLFRSAFDGLEDSVSFETGLNCPEPTLAQQNFAEEADINTIVNKFLRTGILPDSVSLPQFGDFSQSPSDYQSALNLVIAGEQAFAALPANIRARFDNDPVKYVNFFENPDNREEAIELGLVNPPSDISTPAASSRAEGGGDVDQTASPSDKSSSSRGGKKSSKSDD